MIGITFIGSGSKGNCALLELGSRYYLLDAGLSCRRIKEFLEDRQLGFEDLSGIFITHEHEDHIKGLRVLLSRRNDLPVYCTRGTMCALGSKNIEVANHNELMYGRNLDLGNCDCLPFKVPHDATEPAGLRFSNSDRVMCLATDLGHVTPEVIEHMKDADLVCIESNYDEDMLRSCSYPVWLKRRIRSPMGHLPNEGVRGILSRMKKTPEVVVLMHVSQESNTPALIRESLEPFFANSGARFKTARFSVAEQDHYGERLTVGSNLPTALKQALLFHDREQKTAKVGAR
ncbi:MAG TPA: MBL fold metallo-hydrolase [Candidatus Riflebacteria bacterium]|nr:MBL fold metallo-hydrolase [Candidatus Riflebacteria bacterium]